MLLGGSELLVRGGGRIALALRVPVIVVALTIVAFGTSMPEIMVSVTAAVDGSPVMALSNVIGSNIANIALVLGAASLVSPIAVGRELLRREVPALILLQIAVPAVAWDGQIGRLDGALLLSMGAFYNLLLVRDAIGGRRELSEDEEVEGGGDLLTNVTFLVVGVALLAGGAQFFVEGAKEFAVVLGVTERVIALTVVALGTSAPEVVTAMMASFRDENDMAVGNSLGSNILNVALALGVAAMIEPIVLRDPGVWQDMLVAFVVTLLLVPMILRGRHVSRSEGGLLVTSYCIYVVMLAQ